MPMRRPWASSLGVGADAQWGAAFSGGVTTALALNGGPQTRAGTLRALIHLNIRH